jgi:hypothetical protein
MNTDETKRLRRLEKLSRLADVFHDAVVRPEYQLTKVVQDLSS